MSKARLLKADGTVVETVELLIDVTFEMMKAGKKCDAARCPLADALRAFFGPFTEVTVDWDRILAWPHSKAAVVECTTPPRLKQWMADYDTSTCVAEMPKPLRARFSARLTYAACDRRKVEEWVARWQEEVPAVHVHAASESWRAQIQAIVQGGVQ